MTGCAIHPRVTTVDISSPQAALDELIRQSQEFGDFNSKVTFQLEALEKQMQFQGSVERSNGVFVIDINGPFGIELATVAIDDEDCVVQLPQTGKVIEVSPHEPLSVPGLPHDLPSPNLLTQLLIPIVNLGDRGWHVRSSIYPDTLTLLLTPDENENIDSLRISIDITPVRVQRQECWSGGTLKYVREFGYSSRKSLYPNEITIYIDDIKLNIRYHKIHFVRKLSGLSWQAHNVQ